MVAGSDNGSQGEGRHRPALKLAIAIAMGLVVWLLPRPEALTPEAWRLLAIFVATIVAGILRSVLIISLAMWRKVHAAPPQAQAPPVTVAWVIRVSLALVKAARRTSSTD